VLEPPELELLELLELELLELLELELLLVAPPELLELLDLEPPELLELEPPEELLLVAPPELLELLELLELITTVAEVGDPKSAAPPIETSVTENCLPTPAAVIGTEIIWGEVSPSLHVSVPLAWL